jgi:REP element-mobilizing transposase RayT
MVIGYHVIMGFYGFWLPNDPRGSWSQWVGSWELYRYGGSATTVTSPDRLNPNEHEHEELRAALKSQLKYPAVVLSGVQARAVGHGFAVAAQTGQHSVYACAILPEHVHIVFGQLRFAVETVSTLFKQKATMQLSKEGFQLPKLWARGYWKNFIDTEEEMLAAIDYVEQNPVKEGKPLQKWSFVQPYDGR